MELEALFPQVGYVLDRHHGNIGFSGLKQCRARRRLTRLPQLEECEVRVIVPVVNAGCGRDKLIGTPLLHIERTGAMRRRQDVFANLVEELLGNNANRIAAHAADACAAAIQPVGYVVAEVPLQCVRISRFPELEPVARFTRIGVCSLGIVRACVIERPRCILGRKFRMSTGGDIHVNALTDIESYGALVVGIVKVRRQVVFPANRKHRSFARRVIHRTV